MMNVIDKLIQLKNHKNKVHDNIYTLGKSKAVYEYSLELKYNFFQYFDDKYLQDNDISSWLEIIMESVCSSNILDTQYNDFIYKDNETLNKIIAKMIMDYIDNTKNYKAKIINFINFYINPRLTKFQYVNKPSNENEEEINDYIFNYILDIYTYGCPFVIGMGFELPKNIIKKMNFLFTDNTKYKNEVADKIIKDLEDNLDFEFDINSDIEKKSKYSDDDNHLIHFFYYTDFNKYIKIFE